MKIDPETYKDENGEFFEYQADAHIYIDLAELCSLKHSKYLPETPYLYIQKNIFNHLKEKKINAFKVKRKTPYLPLENLDAPAEKLKDFQWTEEFEVDAQKNLEWIDLLLKFTEKKKEKEEKLQIDNETEKKSSGKFV